MSELTSLEQLEQKPRDKRTALEQCIIDAARLEDMRDGDYERQLIAAAELSQLRARVAELEKVADAARHYVFTRAPGSSVTTFPAFQRLQGALKDLEAARVEQKSPRSHA